MICLIKRFCIAYNFQVQIKLQKYSVKSNLNKVLKEMPLPQDRTHIVDAQKQRLRIKEKSARYVPGTVSLQVLGSGAPGTPASVYLFTDQSRYLFNCGEGTQRLAHEHKTKLSRLEHIFMTRTSWEHLGGLPGLSLTVQDTGVPALTLHGPAGLDEIFRGMRRFVVLKDLKVQTVNCEFGEEYDDQVLNIVSIPLKKKVVDNEFTDSVRISPAPELDETDYFEHESGKGTLQNKSTMDTSSNMDNNIKRAENVVISYICKLKPKPGCLNLEKCVEKGIRPGPLLGQLKNGLNVTLPDGRIVKADDVRAPTDPGPVFIFLDVPSIEYLESLNSASASFEKYQNSSKDKCLRTFIVIHFAPDHILKNAIYQNFIKKFHKSTRHLILNSTNKFSGYLAAHRIQWQLNQIDQEIFPVLREPFQNEIPTKNLNKKLKLTKEKEVDENCDYIFDKANSLTTYHLRPKKGLDRTNEPVLRPLDYIQETQIIEGFSESLASLKSELLQRPRIGDVNYPQLVFLGTGSCIPNKTRNVSSILLHTSDTSCILLDCGEGTWGQIVRFYGEIKAKEILRKIKAIYISHLHADHHIGLIGILKARQALLESNHPAILLLAPIQIESWLCFYNHRIESISDEYFLIPNGNLINLPFSSQHTTDLSINSIQTCLVKHCPHSFGIALEVQIKNETIKIVYSGDTMPCNDLIELGMNATILIHEATMEDELINEANFKMHSTVSQAVEQGQKMNAKYTILTHFSQRYAKLPRIENFIGNNVGVAFDNMQISLNDLKYLHSMYPTLKLMFSEHCDELEQKALKRSLKKDRKERILNIKQSDKSNI